MNKLTNKSKLAILVVIVAVAVILVARYGGQYSAQAPGTSSGTSSTNTTGTSVYDNGSIPSGVPSNNVNSGNNINGVGSTNLAPMTFITPVPGETWKIGAANPIGWTREGKVTGQIELLDASTMKLVGVIISAVDPHQTSYTWNTRDIYLSLTNPLKKNVVPGRYVVQLSFDASNVPTITSQPINIVQ